MSYSQLVGGRGPERKKIIINNSLTVQITMK
jgi:hypothetical protein